MSPRLLLMCVLFAVSYLAKEADSACAAPRGGCYKDDPLNRALPTWVRTVSSPQACIGLCKLRNFKYAGIQDGYGCRCGTKFDLYGPATNCNKKCKNGQVCGGWNANTVYAVNGTDVNRDVDADDSSTRGGCYKDDQSNRALPTRVATVSSPQACIDACKSMKADYAGIQNGHDCWCGTNFDLHGPSTNCNKKCENGQICGGWDTNTVYAVNPSNYCCYKDDPLWRALPTWVGIVSSPQACIDLCKSRNAEYAGIQDGQNCWCGTNFDRYGAATNCNKKCKNGQICGGWGTNTVYAVGDADKLKTDNTMKDCLPVISFTSFNSN